MPNGVFIFLSLTSPFGKKMKGLEPIKLGRYGQSVLDEKENDIVVCSVNRIIFTQ